ncbi:MAG: hypothetical protein ACRDSJ_07140 [Rubrobacteraceae bacterium]
MRRTIKTLSVGAAFCVLIAGVGLAAGYTQSAYLQSYQLSDKEGSLVGQHDLSVSTQRKRKVADQVGG